MATFRLRGNAVATESGSGRVLVDGVEVGTFAFAGDGYQIPAALGTTWNPGIPGGVPTNAVLHTTIDSATYGNGVADATTVINAAIQAAGDTAASSGVQQIVYLPAGTYRTTNIIQANRSQVTLRGAGPALTRLISDHSYHHLRFGRVWPSYPQSIAYNVVGSMAKGSSTFVLSNANAAGVLVGDILQIDQQDRLVSSGGYVWFWDGRYQKRGPITDYSSQGPLTNQSPDNAANYTSPANIGGPWRSVGQQVEIIAKSVGSSETTLTIRGVFHIAFDAARFPQAFHTGTRWTSTRSSMPGTHYAGIEDLYFSGSDSGTIAGWNLAHCWIKNIEIDGNAANAYGGAMGPAIELAHAYRCEVRESYVHHDRNMINNSASYGIFLTAFGTDNLIENNIAMWMCKPIMLNVTGGGNVVGYNYVDQAIILNTNWQENAIDGCHQTFSHADLVEGNHTPNLGSDTTHGNAGWMTHFRNYATGRNSMQYDIGATTGYSGANLRAAGADAYSGPHTFVGNVLGAAWGAASYEWNAASHSGSPPIYRLGDNSNGGSGGVWDDGTAAANAYRHANWDAATNGVVNLGGESTVLAASLYLAAKPAWFGALAWPWVDPYGATSGDRVKALPAKARYDAGTPNG
jgi:hypothetical protein